ncbi:MAG: metallophosphoesterase [Fibrobacteraceae bacterium]|nr:metallophosphoesterase [Fibrobacteraceae bacterium]
MDRKELVARWTKRCDKFVPARPQDYNPESFVFSAEKSSFPFEAAKKISEDDTLEKLSFNDKSIEHGLGSLECSKESLEILRDFLKKEEIKIAFDYSLSKSDPIHVVKDETSIFDRDIWFIGDIHGDLLAFRTAIAFINSNSKRKPIYVLLGDIFDRNDYGLNVIVEVLNLFKNSPDSIFMIAGNHDEGLDYKKDSFNSIIDPHQFTDYLNEIENPLIEELVKGFIQLIKKLPAGLVLPNGLFVTHGGVPSRPERSVKNVWKDLNNDAIKDLIKKERRQFLNNRFQWDVTTGTKLTPEFSWVEIINFSHAIEKAYGVAIRSMLRGHDHCDLYRHEWAKSSFSGNDNCEDADRVRNVLTMTSMTLMHDSEKKLPSFGKHEYSFPSVARYEPSDILPRVYTIEFQDEDVTVYYGEVQKIFSTQTLEYIQNRLERLTNEQQGYQEDLQDYQKKYESLAKDVECLTAKAESAKSPVSEQKQILNIKKEELTKVQKEIQLKQNEIDAFELGKKETEDTKKEEAQFGETKSKESTQDGAKQGIEVQKKKTEKNFFQKEFDKFKDLFNNPNQKKILEKELDNLRKFENDAAEEIAKLDNEFHISISKLEKANLELNSLNEEKNKLERKIRNAQDDIDDVQEQIEKVQGLLAKTENQRMSRRYHV